MKHRTPTGDTNLLLARLPAAELGRLERTLEPATLSFKETIYEQGKRIEQIHFPTSGVVSLVTLIGDADEIVETGTVGREGFVGVPAFLGASVAPGRAICQVPGTSLRMSTADFLRTIERTPVLRQRLMRFTNALLAMVSQSAGCLAAHSVQARMARWLLITQDRVGQSEFPLTQEFLGDMLGVRRSSVNIAGRALQKAGLIAYKRGTVMIKDRRGLERKSCECYERIREEFQRSLRDATRS